MNARRRKSLVVVGLLLATLICGIVWQACSPNEPRYGGKRLSVWLDELCTLDFAKRADPATPQIKAMRAMGTNAIPWLLKEFRPDAAWRWKLNQVLNKQGIIKYRFPNRDHLRRGTMGFYALGELGE